MTTIATQAYESPALDLGRALVRAWHFFVKDIGPLIIAGLIAGVLSVISLGILAGPLAAGLYGMVAARISEGRQPEVGDVFGGMDRFWSYFGAALVLAIVVGIAWITIIGGVLLTTIWLYVFPLMVERRIGLWEAMGESKDLVVRSGFWEHLALVVILAVIASVANGLLALLSVPFTVVVVAVAYYMATGRGALIERD
jgi:hypothetical protein